MPPLSSTRFTAEQLAVCAEREVKYRRRVYAYRVSNGKMKQSDAIREQAMMEQIAAEYRAKADEEAAKFDLFGGGA